MSQSFEKRPTGNIFGGIESLMRHPNVFIKNKPKVLEKISVITDVGQSSLQVISDFDKTLTKNSVDGKRNLVSHSVLPAFHEVRKEFLENLKGLISEFHKVENNPTLPADVKAAQLHNIWERSNILYVDEKFTFEFICKAVDANKIVYRDGAQKLLAVTEANQIPFLIFSAGIGDIILESLKNQELLLSHVHVLANFMVFDETSPFEVVGFKEPLIHSLNKGEIDIKATPFGDAFTSRSNTILLGDSIGDLAMAAGKEHDVLLTVGFLNQDVEANIENYSTHFDVVITNDSSFDWVIKLIESSVRTKYTV